MPDDSLDLEEIQRKAEIVADATGRKVEDVVVDLLDDGEANFSAGSDSKDMFDVAQEKAEKVKALIITLMPIIALLGAGGLEGFGIVDVTGWGEDSVWDEDAPQDEPHYPPVVVWGCTDPAAENFNNMAIQDDGSCWYEDECEWDWQWSDTSHVNQSEKTISVEMEFHDIETCDDEMHGYFEIILVDENDQEINHEHRPEPFQNHFWVQHEFTDLNPHTYQVEVSYYEDSGSHWTSPHTPVFNIPQDEPEEEEEVDCAPYLYDGTVIYDNASNEIEAQYDIDTDCDEIQIIVYLDVGKYSNNRTNLTYAGWSEANHTIVGQQGNVDSVNFNNVTNGTYLARVTVYYDGEQQFYYERDVEVIRDE